MMYFETDDLRQSYVVAKNEIRKFIRGKRFTLYVVLIAIVFALTTALPYVFGGNIGETPGDVIASYVSFVNLLIILAATLFAAVTIVSEFEERTALILFTRPIKKTSIFIGKIVGCIVLETVMIALFYAGIAVVSLIAAGGVSAGLLTSLGLAILFTIAASGIAMFFSSIMKKGSTSAILTFVFLLIIVSVISGAISISTDPWFMVDQASGTIASCIPEFLEMTREMMISSGLLTPEQAATLIAAPDLFKASVAMVAWGAASLILSWLAFIRREF
ncbi:MAG: ABC transporter permease [Candidatus Methanoplasma sp.]|jgi:ABC-2 type transport system permease protein|nr:ABC transporter permease [Candidatus Methanoplasma sp.]